MASTARTIITAALREIRVLGAGDVPTDDDAEDALYQLKNMMDSWWLERLAVYEIRQDSGLTWAAAQSSRTVGTGGNFNITRPFRITGVVFTVNGVDYPVRKMIERAEYDAIPLKTAQSSFPEFCFYDPQYPLGVLYAFPVPSASVTVAINSWQQIQNFSTLDTQIALPPGYERAIQKNLAIEIAPSYGPSAQPSPELKVQAMQAKANLKTINAPSMVATLDAGIVQPWRPSNIYSDG